MVCKEDVCHWFRYIQTYERLDLLCKLLHLCSSHELRFISAVIEDQARTDYNTLRDSAFKANESSELKKLSPNLFSASDRSALIVYLSLLNSMNMVCAHVMFNMLNKIEAQRIACHLHASTNTRASETDRCSAPGIDSDTAEDIILMYTMAAYHPAFTIAQRIQLSDYLQKAQTYFTECFIKHNPEDSAPHVVGSTYLNASSSTSSSSCAGSPHNHTSKPQSNCPSAIQSPVHVSSIELKRSQWDNSGHRHMFHVQVSWSNGEVTEICRSYHELHNFQVELLRLFPKDSGAHRQQRHIPYLPQEKRNRTSSQEFEDDINKYMKQLSTLPDYILQCDHMTNFFRSHDGLRADNQHIAHEVNKDTQLSAESDQSSALDSNNISFEELSSSPPQNVAVPTAHALTTVVQRRYSYSSVVASPLTHHSPIPSPLSSPHVSPSQHLGSLVLAMSVSPSVRDMSTPETISCWLKNLRLHKYAQSLSKYTWQQLAQLDDKALDKEGLTDGAKKKFRKQLESQLAKLASSTNGVVKFPDPGCHGPSPSNLSGHAISPVPFSPVNSGSPTNIHQNSGVHLPLTVMTRMAYSPSITNSVGSTNSIGSSSPAYSDYSGISPPSSPRNQAVLTPGDSSAAPKIKPGEVYSRGGEALSLTADSGDDPRAFSSPLYEAVGSQHSVPDPHSSVVMMDVGPALAYCPQTTDPGVPVCQSVRSFVMSPPQSVVSVGPDMETFPPGVRGQSVCLRPRIPLSAPTIHPCPPINNIQCLPPLLPNPPVSATTLGSPRMPNANCQLDVAALQASKPPSSSDVIVNSNLEAAAVGGGGGGGGGLLGSKMPVGYGAVPPVHGLMPRAPSLMGPAPGCHIIQRPSNLGIHMANAVTNNNLTYSMAHLPTPTNGPTLFDANSTPVSLPPTNIPPPMSSVLTDSTGPYHGFHNSSISLGSGTTTTASSASSSPIPGVLGNGIVPTPTQVNAGSMISPPVNSPTPPTVSAPASNGSNSTGTCRCNCQQCHGPDALMQQAPAQPNPPTATPPTTVQLTYPHPPIPWPPNAVIPGGYPHPGGFLSTSSNGLISASPNFPPFSLHHHLPHSPFSLPSNWSPEMLFDPRNYAMFQATAANQGVLPTHVHPLYQPYIHGYPSMVHNPNNSNKGLKNPPVMCYNCGTAGHQAQDCKGPTMDGIVRSAQFHLNIQPRNEGD